jgi:hypothetical protein
MLGYGPVAKTLMRSGLLDELCLWIHPILARVGTTDDMIWGQDVHARLALENVKTLASGIVTLSTEGSDLSARLVRWVTV